MTPVDQTRFGKPEGNCYAACIASILDRSLEEFDHRPEDFENGFTESWSAFMATKGLALVEIDVEKQPGVIVHEDLHYMAAGPSPRGQVDHVVVQRNGRMVHDPHPSRDGLEKVAWLIFLVNLR